MTADTVVKFRFRRHEYISPSGELVNSFLNENSREFLLSLYRAMVFLRAFDAKAIAFQRTGVISTYPSSLGQEAVSVGIGSAMNAEDVLLPDYRQLGAHLWRGGRMESAFLFWGGDERGSDHSGVPHDFPLAIPIGTQYAHAVGVAYSFFIRNEPRVAVAVGGDGSTSKGDFYEAMNFAGVKRLPVVFVINNNRWAISCPFSEQTAAETIAQKALAVGFSGEQADGNDVVAVHYAVRGAIEKARKGSGPTLVELLTYRLGDHTTADDAIKYRDPEEVSREAQNEPLLRMRKFLFSANMWSHDEERALIEEASKAVNKAANGFASVQQQPPESIFDYLFESLPAPLEWQRIEVAQKGGKNGKDNSD